MGVFGLIVLFFVSLFGVWLIWEASQKNRKKIERVGAFLIGTIFLLMVVIMVQALKLYQWEGIKRLINFE